MKHTLETIETFICLRAKGWSYGRIADKLIISKSTAYDWAGKYRDEVAKFRAIELEAIHERLLADYETEITWLASELKRVQEVLRERDYGYEDTHKLWWYQGALMKRIDKRCAPITWPDPEPESTERDRTEPNDSLADPQPPTERNRTEPNDSTPDTHGVPASAGKTEFESNDSCICDAPPQAVPSPGGEGQGEGGIPVLIASTERNRTEPNDIVPAHFNDSLTVDTPFNDQSLITGHHSPPNSGGVNSKP